MQQTPLILPEKWNEVSSSVASGISIATFNTLRRNYEFDEETWVTEEQQTWEYRLSLLKRIFATLNSDLVCVQEAELDTMEEDFKFMKEEFGYELLKGKAKENDTHLFTKPSIFFKPSKFNLLWSTHRTRTILSLFEDKTTGIIFFVVAVHLQGGNTKCADRCYQLKSAFTEVLKEATARKIASKDLCAFFCGDFNAKPWQNTHILIRNGKLTDEQVNETFGKPIFKFQHPWQIEDACEKIPSRPYTFKSGLVEDAVFDVLDFLYYTPNTIEVLCVRDPLTEEQRRELEKGGLPNAWNPSDHLPLVGLFKFKKPREEEVLNNNSN